MGSTGNPRTVPSASQVRPKLIPGSSQNRPKTVPSLSQNCPILVPSSSQDGDLSASLQRLAVPSLSQNRPKFVPTRLLLNNSLVAHPLQGGWTTRNYWATRGNLIGLFFEIVYERAPETGVGLSMRPAQIKKLMPINRNSPIPFPIK